METLGVAETPAQKEKAEPEMLSRLWNSKFAFPSQFYCHCYFACVCVSPFCHAFFYPFPLCDSRAMFNLPVVCAFIRFESWLFKGGTKLHRSYISLFIPSCFRTESVHFYGLKRSRIRQCVVIICGFLVSVHGFCATHQTSVSIGGRAKFVVKHLADRFSLRRLFS